MRPWEKHPPWAHWSFFVVWVVTATLGPMSVSIWLLGEVMDAPSAIRMLWLGIVLCAVWGACLAVDWLLVRWLQERVDGWTPWQPPEWRWLRS